MIVKGDTPKSSFFKTAIVLLLSIVGIGGLWYFLPHLSSWKKPGLIYCDAEIVRGDVFIAHGNSFFNGKTQSKEQAFQGDFSSKIKMGEGFQFGFGIDFTEFEAGKTYVASVWRKKENHGGKSSLVIMDKNKNLNFEIQESTRQKNGWEYLEKKFTIPFQKEIKDLKIYVRSDGTGVVYFDELKIVEKENPTTFSLATFQPEIIDLKISKKGIKKLEQKRKEALQIGILQTEDKDWVNASISSNFGNETMPVELRLKGDWLDHLKENKWSFRVKVKDPFAWKRMKTFSLQSPATREFLNEWILHQWWQKEDVLTPRYDFVELRLNGKSLGVYAFEEHFEKQLPESNQRREGVIVRFSEEGFWADVKMRTSDLEGNSMAHVNTSASIKSAEVRPFKENKILGNPILKQQLETAQNLLKDFIENKRPLSEIFELEKMAKYFAICDLMQAQHSAVWHNLRFYFNPVLNRLEPIGFDGFPTYDYPFLLMSEGALSAHFKEYDDITNSFFSDTSFVKQYISNLFIFSKKENIDSFFETFEDDLAARNNFIKKEFTDYNFSRTALQKRIEGIRSNIFPFNNLTLKAYFENGKNEIRVGNTHSLPIEIIGTSFGKNQSAILLNEPLVLPAYVTTPFYKDLSKKRKKEAPNLSEIIRQEVEYQKFSIPKKHQYVFFKVLGHDKIFHSKILNWNAPENFAGNIPKESTTPFLSNKLFTIKDKKVFFHAGKFIVSEDIEIPKGYTVYFTEGTEIDFIKNAKFLSYSPLQMKGSNDNPIKIISSDGSANGFTILQAEPPSQLEYVIFENLNTLRKAKWNLTGAVTFYESEVSIENCVFTKNNCEDALNLVRTNFKIDRSIFSKTKSDGLDLDFCNGSINNCSFLNTTNDGLDISGSNIFVVNGKMDNCGDKAISVGEASQATIMSAEIKNSNIGIASKDLSTVIIESISLENCSQGFTAYQKKIEFGGSKIEVKDYSAKGIKKLYNIRAGCTLILKEKLIKNEMPN